MGISLLLVGIMLLMQWHKVIEIWALNIMPVWLQDLSVIK